MKRLHSSLTPSSHDALASSCGTASLAARGYSHMGGWVSKGQWPAAVEWVCAPRLQPPSPFVLNARRQASASRQRGTGTH